MNARCDIVELLGLVKPVNDMELLMLADRFIDEKEAAKDEQNL